MAVSFVGGGKKVALNTIKQTNKTKICRKFGSWMNFTIWSKGGKSTTYKYLALIVIRTYNISGDRHCLHW
jgi:hypothetical protein